MNSVREILQINEQELQRGLAGTGASWHAKYAKSAWIYVGNLENSALTEGDVICVLSQYGELQDFYLVRDEETGKSKGFAFAKYEDSRSCVLAVDNFCGISLCGRTVRVDHVENYRLPKHLAEKEQDELQRKASGVVGDATADFSAAAVVDKETGNSNYYHGQELVNEYSLQQGQDLFAPRVIKATNKNESVTPTLPLSNNSNGSMNDDLKHQRKREMKHQRRIEKETRKRERNSKRMEREERRRQRRSRNIRNDKDGDDDDDILLERHSRKSHSAKSKIHKDDESSYSSSEEAKEREKKEHPKDRKKGSRRKHDKVVHGR